MAVLRFFVTAATTFLGLLAVTFFIGRVVPIDPALAIVGDRAPAHVVERVREQLGLNLPLYEQFWIYLKQALSGDFGTSVLTTNLSWPISPGCFRRPSSLPPSAR